MSYLASGREVRISKQVVVDELVNGVLQPVQKRATFTATIAGFDMGAQVYKIRRSVPLIDGGVYSTLGFAFTSEIFEYED